jgi:hypothetical protein
VTDEFRHGTDNENFPYGADTTPFIMIKSGRVSSDYVGPEILDVQRQLADAFGGWAGPP